MGKLKAAIRLKNLNPDTVITLLADDPILEDRYKTQRVIFELLGMSIHSHLS